MYHPKPVDTSGIELPEGIEALVEHLAENNHDIWAQQRLRDGWKYGPQRNDETKTHPDLVPYDQLPEGEKEYDRQTAIGTVKAILGLGYRISKA